VSRAPGPDKKIDYVLGLFTRDQHSGGSWDDGFGAGSAGARHGSRMHRGLLHRRHFPNCLSRPGPGDVNFLSARFLSISG